MATRKSSPNDYDPRRAEQFWSRRLASTNSLAAVLTYNARPELNRAYDEWEKQSLLSHFGKKLSGKRVLDLGAGVGRISLVMAQQGAEVIALDNSRAMLERIAGSAAKSRLSSRITTVHAPSHQIPLDDRTVDVVICFGLLEHLPGAERRQTLNEAARVLKKNGRMLVVVNNMENPLLTARYLLAKQKRDGYFVTLVGLPWVTRIAKSLKLKSSVLAANPGYALVHYLLDPHRKQMRLTSTEFRAICQFSLRADLEMQFPESLRRRLASHFLVELRYR